MGNIFVRSDGTQLAYVKETNWGETTANPAFQVVRITGESLNINRETVTSSELRADRNVTDQIAVSGGAAGGFNFELSHGVFDDFIASLLYNDWTDNTITNGVKRKSMTMEKRFYRGTDGEGDALYEYFRYRGMIVNTMELSVTASEIITGSFDMMGLGGDTSGAAITGGTYTPALTADVLSASEHVGSLSLSSLVSPKLRAISLSMTNNLAGANVVGSMDYADIGAGQFGVSGNIEAYFETRHMYEKFLNGDAVGLELMLGKTSGQRYKLTLPKIKFSSGEVLAGSTNEYVMCNMGFQALYDAGIGATVKLERAVA